MCVCSVFHFKIHLKGGRLLEEWANRFLALCHLWSAHSAACRTHQHHNEKQSTHTYTDAHTHIYIYCCTACKDKYTYIRQTHTHTHTKLNLLTNTPSLWITQACRRSHTLRPTVWASTAFHSAFPFTVEKSALWPRVFPTFRKEAARECHASALREWEEGWIDAQRLCTGCSSFKSWCLLFQQWMLQGIQLS